MKDNIEEQEEQYSLLSKELREKSRDHELLKRSHTEAKRAVQLLQVSSQSRLRCCFCFNTCSVWMVYSLVVGACDLEYGGREFEYRSLHLQPETKLREERGLSGCRKGLKTVPLAQALLSLKPAKTTLVAWVRGTVRYFKVWGNLHNFPLLAKFGVRLQEALGFELTTSMLNDFLSSTSPRIHIPWLQL